MNEEKRGIAVKRFIPELTALLAAVAFLAIAAGCSATGDKGAETVGFSTQSGFSLTSTAFKDREQVPIDMVCKDRGGFDASPELTWAGAPEGTETFALIMDDEDPPCGPGDTACIHWAVFNIPGDKTGMATNEGALKVRGINQGKNYTGSTGYAGPCSPSEHRYHITVYALGRNVPALRESESMTRSQFTARFEQDILASATIEGVFSP